MTPHTPRHRHAALVAFMDGEEKERAQERKLLGKKADDIVVAERKALIKQAFGGAPLQLPHAIFSIASASATRQPSLPPPAPAIDTFKAEEVDNAEELLALQNVALKKEHR